MINTNNNTFILGIDLGTTNSCVAVWDAILRKAKVVETGLGPSNSNIVPSIVAFPLDKEGNRIQTPQVGRVAQNQMMMNPEGTVYEAKRFMGRSFKEIKESDDKTGWLKGLSYKIAPKDGDKNKQVVIEIPGVKQVFEPKQIGAEILRQIVVEVRKKFNIDPKVKAQAVITIPAYFNDHQRTETKEAGEIAGLEVLRIITEPTAGAIAYGIENNHKNGIIVVYDMGGGTFDVSILRTEHDGGSVYEVLATNGDTHLGGADFDRKIIEFIEDDIRKNFGLTISDSDAIQRVREAAEKAKKELSTSFETEISLPFIGPKGEHYLSRLTRAQFEQMVADLIEKRAANCCKQSLKDAQIRVSDINEVVMIGGMTRMPKIVEWAKQFYGKNPCREVNPDEVVALGACIQASTIAGVSANNIVTLDVTPLSLGIETLGGISTVLVPRNTTIPTNKSEVFSTAVDNQSEVVIKVLQGERQMAADNKTLGTCTLRNIKPAPRGIPQIEVKFAIDANGLVNLTACDKATGNTETLSIENANKTSKEEIERMKAEAEKYGEEDQKRRELVELKNNAHHLCQDAEKLLSDHSAKLDKEKGLEIHKAVDNLKQALAGQSKDELQAACDALKTHMPTLKQLAQNSGPDQTTQDDSNTSEPDHSATN